MNLNLLRQTVQNLEHLIFRVDKKEDTYVFTFFEGMLAKQLGLDTEKVEGISYDALFPHLSDQAEKVKERIENGESVTTEFESMGRTFKVIVRPLIKKNKVKGATGIVEEITLQKRLLRELKEKESLFDSLSQEGILILQEGRIVGENERVKALTGYSQEALRGINPLRLTISELRPAFFEQMMEGKDEESEFILLGKEEKRFPAALRFRRGTYQEKPALFLIIRDLSERKLKEEALRQLAFYDSLTHLPNRALFLEQMSERIDMDKRRNGRFALLLIDLDRFKSINDTMGHRYGDMVLQEAANRLRQTLGEKRMIARLGGDEFAILLTDMEDAQEVTETIGKIREAFIPPFRLSGYEYYSSISIGVSLFPEDGDDGEMLFKNADTALSRAKEQGRNTYQFYTSSMYTEALHRLVIENHLRKALEKEEFMLYYQPLVDVSTGRITGVEALIRWQHPELGMVSPGEFIPVAEETGLILPIGYWVLHTAIRKGKEWIDSGYPPLRLNVNLSARQFQQPDLIEQIREILQKTGFPTNHLVIELTESIIMQNAEENASKLQKLKEMGVKIAIDDFGTGYSSLSYLKRFPIDTLKIDSSFVWEISSERNNGAIATAVISLANILNLKVVAEGVETTEQAEFLQTQGCFEMQGYLFSKPLPNEKLEEMFLSKREYF